MKHVDWYSIFMEGSGSLDVPRPATLPEAGAFLYFRKIFSTPVGAVYTPGDEVYLLRRTNEAPYGKLSELGNWVALSKYGVSVWSNIEWMLAIKVISAVKPRKKKSDGAE